MTTTMLDTVRDRFSGAFLPYGRGERKAESARLRNETFGVS